MSAAPTELNSLLSVFTQGCISGFALIPPWALQECRPCRALCRIGHLRCCVVVLCSLNVFGCVNGLLCSVVFVYLFDCDCIVCSIEGGDWCGRAMSPNGAILLQSLGRKPWVICYRYIYEPQRGGTFPTNAKPQTAKPQTQYSRCECRSCGAQFAFVRVHPGLHFGLCPHYTLGFAGVSPLQGSLSYWAFAVLCRGIVFIKCVWVCKWIVMFGRVCVFV